MRDRIYICNRLMRPLKAYIESGESNESVLRLVEVLNQLEDGELAFVMAKYVTLATYRENGITIKQPNATQIKDHLQIKDIEFKFLQNRVSSRVYELHFAEAAERERLKHEDWNRKFAEREAERRAETERYIASRKRHLIEHNRKS